MQYTNRIYQQDASSTLFRRWQYSAKTARPDATNNLFEYAKREKRSSKACVSPQVAARYKAGWRADQDEAVQRTASLLGLSTTHISPRGKDSKEKWACEVAVGGSLVSVKGRKPTHIKNGGGVRGEVKGFSKAARRRLIRKIGSIDRNAVPQMPIFLTLTYPRDWPSDPKQWKKHLDTWVKRLKRKHSKVCAIWKLEPQKRGAPHYHLIVFNVPHVN